MTRALTIQKWMTYTVVGLLPLWLLDAYILSRYPVFGLTPQLLPLAVVCVSILEGAYAGTGFGMGVGLLWTLTYPGNVNLRILLLALVGMAIGALAQYALRQSFVGYLLCSFVLLAGLNGLTVLQERMLQHGAFAALVEVAIGDTVLTLLWSPLVYWLFHKIFRKVGGNRLA